MQTVSPRSSAAREAVTTSLGSIGVTGRRLGSMPVPWKNAVATGPGQHAWTRTPVPASSGTAGVGGKAAAERQQRRDVDHRPTAALDHGGQGGAGEPGWRGHVDADQRDGDGGIEAGERPVPGEPGVVDQQVQLGHRGDQVFGRAQPAGVGEVGDVHVDGARPGFGQPGRKLGQPGAAAGDQGQVVAVAGQPGRERGADAR